MSYDVFLQRFRDGEPEAVDSPDAWSILEGAWDSPPDEFDFSRVSREGDEGDLYAVQIGQPIDSLMFNHAGRGVYHLMFDVAVAGEMAIIPPDVGPFVVREEQLQHLPADLRATAVVIRSGEELVRAMEEA